MLFKFEYVIGGSHLIADFEVTNHCTDQGLLNEVADNAREILEVKTIEVVVDKGYESSSIEVELQTQTSISCFLLNENGTVTCPTGYIMSKTKMRGKNTIYANKDACRQCPNRCTGGKTHKTVRFGPNTKYVPVKMFEDLSSFYYFK